MLKIHCFSYFPIKKSQKLPAFLCSDSGFLLANTEILDTWSNSLGACFLIHVPCLGCL